MTSRGDTERWGVVGGGMLGLTLALRLAQRGHRVTVYEGAQELGGLASAWQLGDIMWDRHYHVTLLSDTAIRDLLRELDLETQMRWVQTRTGFFVDGELMSMSDTLEFLRFPPLGLLSKLRLGGNIFYASRISDWRRLERVPVGDWLRRWSGEQTFERIWRPLLRAKLGDAWERTSAAFIWATIARMYAARRTGMKKEMFGYLPGGYDLVLRRLGETLEGLGVDIRLGARVSEIAPDEGMLRVEADGAEPEHFDRVAATVAAPVAARLCTALGADERSRLEGVDYQGIVCASLLLKRKLADYYVTNITDDWVPFTAVIEMSALVDPADLGGHHLVYLPKYVTADDPVRDLDDDQLRERFVAALLRMYPALQADDVLAFRVSRVRWVFPLPTVGYSERLPPMRSRTVPGLWLVNSSHILNGTLNVNETVQLAHRALREIHASHG